VNLADQRLRRSEIRRLEALGKPIIDRCEQFKRLFCSASVVPEPREARRGAQFPGQSALPARQVESLRKVILGHRHGIRPAPLHNKIAFDAQQLGHAPARFRALGSRKSFLNCNETLGHLFRTAGGFCERTEESWVTMEKPGLTKLIKGAAEK
jgi:hypothetical protein